MKIKVSVFLIQIYFLLTTEFPTNSEKLSTGLRVIKKLAGNEMTNFLN